MITFGNKQLRNDKEQIKKNQEDIARHYAADRVVAEFGIRIIGQLDVWPEEAPAIPEKFGDAYAVGVEAPYDIYVWTRTKDSDILEQGYWFNIGSIAIKGDPGEAGASVVNATVDNNGFITFTLSNGDTIVLDKPIKGRPGKDGEDGGSPSIVVKEEAQGTRITTYDSKGAVVSTAFVPNGKNGQSIQGPAGPAGSFAIKGTIIDISLLPAAETMAPGDAYLVTTANGYDLWVIVGENPSLYEWVNTGALGVGTHVNVAGSAVTSWNADTKVDKVSTTAGRPRAYAVSANGGQTTYPISWDTLPPNTQCIAGRDTDGTISVAWPSNNDDAANKQYVDYAVSQGGGGTFAMESIEADGKAVFLDRNMDLFDARIAFIDLQYDDYDGYRYHINATFCPNAVNDVPSGQQVIPSTNPYVVFWIDGLYEQRISTQINSEDGMDGYTNWKMIVRYIP